jgi:hypothetical protein
LAQPSDDPDFDTQFKQQCQQDYITIKSIYDKIIPKVVTMDELKYDRFSWSQLYARGVDVLDALVFPLLSTVYELLCFVLWLL